MVRLSQAMTAFPCCGTEWTSASSPPSSIAGEIGEVQIGDHELFIEVTGTDLSMVALALNILAANLADRGAVITPVKSNRR